eukprot:6629821-Prymnesium_polylepis.2
MHSIRRDAYELITHHVLRTLEANEELPELHDQTIVYRFFLAVTGAAAAQSKYPDLDTKIRATMQQCMPGFVPHAQLPGCV